MIQQNFLFLLFSVFATVGAHLCFKEGILKIGALNFSLANLFNLVVQVVTSPWLLGGIFLFGLSFLSWLFLISRVQLNMVYPINIGLQVVFLTLISSLVFKEYLSFWQIAGIAVVIMGVFLIFKF